MSYTEYLLGSKHIEVSPEETLYSCNFIQYTRTWLKTDIVLYQIYFRFKTDNVLARIYKYLAQNRQCLIPNIFWAQNTLKFRLRKLYTVVTLYKVLLIHDIVLELGTKVVQLKSVIFPFHFKTFEVYPEMGEPSVNDPIT